MQLRRVQSHLCPRYLSALGGRDIRGGKTRLFPPLTLHSSPPQIPQPHRGSSHSLLAQERTWQKQSSSQRPGAGKLAQAGQKSPQEAGEGGTTGQHPPTEECCL